MNKEQRDAHFKFIREVIEPAVIKAALEKPMTKEEYKFVQELQLIYDPLPVVPQ